MSWIPSPTRVLVLLKRIEKGEDPLQDATELFWLFGMNSLSPDEFRDRILFWINRHLVDSPKGGGFIDPDVKETIFQGPERAAKVILDRLDVLSEKKRVPYRPGVDDDPTGLFVYTHIEASRLTHLLNSESYSERTREVLSNVLNAFTRCDMATMATGGYSNAPWSNEYSVSLEAVGSFLYITQFLILKSDGDYEDAMKSLMEGIQHIQGANILYHVLDRPRTEIGPVSTHLGLTADIHRAVPWIQNLEPRLPCDCFEALRAGSRIKDPVKVVEACQLLAYIWDGWLYPDELSRVVDEEGTLLFADYWSSAAGWIEAKMEESELRDLWNAREEQAAEQRLRTYFFSDELWMFIPKRAQSSLISADRDWYNGKVARIESILNELKIASEELLQYGLWNILEQWEKHKVGEEKDLREFSTLRANLESKRLSPDLSHYEKLCSLPVVETFLKKKGIPTAQRAWFVNVLPECLARLRKARRRAEHESGREWTRKELGKFYAEYMGIGQLGVLPVLSKILLL